MSEEQWTKAEAHWREHHPKQPYADEKHTFEHWESAYRTGHEAVSKYPGKKFEEIEDEVARGYGKAHPGAALPWDTVRPAVKAEWDRLGGVIGPRDSDRGIRTGI
jgi:hypothetical protein